VPSSDRRHASARWLAMPSRSKRGDSPEQAKSSKQDRNSTRASKRKKRHREQDVKQEKLSHSRPRAARDSAHSFGYGHGDRSVESGSIAKDAEVARRLVQICFHHDDVNVGGCSLGDVSLNVHVLESCTVRDLLHMLHLLMPSIRSCDVLQVENRQCGSQDSYLHLADHAKFCEVLRPGDFVVPGRKVKAQERSNRSVSHRQEESHGSRKQEAEFTQVVTFTGFPDSSPFRCLNGAPFERSERLNNKPAFLWAYMDQQYLLCFYPSPDGGREATWRIGLADDMRQQQPNAIAYVQADESIEWPGQVQSQWHLLDPESRQFALADNVQCIDVVQASHNQRVRTPSCSLSCARPSDSGRATPVLTSVAPQRPASSHCRSSAGARAPSLIDSSGGRERLIAVRGARGTVRRQLPPPGSLIAVDMPMNVQVWVDVDMMQRRMRGEQFLHPSLR